jgi:hypothetical protein
MVAVLNNINIYTTVKNAGQFPSGVSLGYPLMDVQGRCASVYDFTEADVTYLEGYEGVDAMEQLPPDWEYPPSYE